MKTIFIGSFVLNLQCHKICGGHLLCGGWGTGGGAPPMGGGDWGSGPRHLVCFGDSPSKLMKGAFYFASFPRVARGIWRYFLVS